MINQYWVGQIPAKPLIIKVKDGSGNIINLNNYLNIKLKLLGSYNEEISTEGFTINTNRANVGELAFVWPTDKSLFDYPGDYILQLELTGTGKRDFTSTHTLRIREFGKVMR